MNYNFDEDFLDLVDVLERRIRIIRIMHERKDWLLLHTALEDLLFTSQTLVHKYCVEDSDGDY